MPAVGVEGLGALRGKEGDCGATGAAREDASDFCNGNASDFLGDAGGCGRGEEEFIVFTAIEGLGEGCGHVEGELSGIHFGGYAGFLAKVGKIGGEAVTEIDGGGGQTVALEPEALANAGLGVEMWGQQRRKSLGDSGRVRAVGVGCRQLSEAREGSGGSAKGAGDVEQVAGACAGAEQAFTTRNAANEDDIGYGDGGLREISAGKRSLVSGGQGKQAVEEALDPGWAAGRRRGQLAWQTQGKKGGNGAGTHSGQVT